MVVLQNDTVRLVVEPLLGARVVSLVDRRTGREWLVQGQLPGDAARDAWAAEDAVFGGAQAFGWDECLPTVAPCTDPLYPAAPRLRDHGDGWGRPVEVDADADRVATVWASRRWPYTFSRSLRLDGPFAVAEYRLEVFGDRPLPILWSMHALLALEPGSRLVVEPAGMARVTHHGGFRLPPAAHAVAWPDGAPLPLDVVDSVEAGRAAKLYVDAPPVMRVAATGTDGAELRFEWDRAFAPALGIWLDYGGWPAGEEGRHQVALEPTTAPDDDLASAMAADRARVIKPGEPVSWTVALELVPGSGTADATEGESTHV